MIDILWEFHQQGRLTDAALRADDAAAASRDLRADVRRLERMVEGLNLANMAMWALLSERLGVSGDQLLHKIREIDASDGSLDGRYRPAAAAPTVCVQCRRPASKGRPKCIYCGALVSGV